MGDEGTGRDVLSAIFGVPRREADARPRVPVSERLVSALREAVWPGLTRDELSRSWRPCLNPSGKRESATALFCAGVGGLTLD